jgi:hypothetical protein
VSEIIGEGNPAVVLSSDRERAVYTAAGIAARLGALVYPSVRIREGGEFPAGIRDLDAFVAKALAETDAGPLADGTSLIVVTHQPLIDMVNIGRTGYGEVVPYTPAAEGWNNPNFTEGHERLLERLIEQAQVNG